MDTMKTFKSTPHRSWLVQRLNKPLAPSNPHSVLASLEEAFSFGGGMRNGGLKGEAMDLIREIWSFDYMGATEYEWGIVPAALQRIVEHREQNDLIARSFEIKLSKVKKHWSDRTRKDPEGSATVWLICHKDHSTDMEIRIRIWALGEHDRDFTLRDSIFLSDVLRPGKDAAAPYTRGWLELDNGALFFADQEMAEKAAALFAVEFA